MPTIEQLIVQIDASTELLRRELAKSESTLNQFSQRTNRSLTSLDASFNKLGRAARTALGAFGIGVGASALVGFAQDAVKAADSIGEVAQAAGFGAERFQRLSLVFRANGVEAQEFESAMRMLNTRLGIFINTGAGPAAKAIQQLGLSQRIANGDIQTAEQFFDAAIEALGDVENAAQGAALEAALFGKEVGPKMQATIAQGLPAINDAAQAVSDVFTDEQIAQADALDKAYRRLGNTIGTNLKAAVIALQASFGYLAGIDELDPANWRTLEQEIEKARKELEYFERNAAPEARVPGGALDQARERLRILELQNLPFMPPRAPERMPTSEEIEEQKRRMAGLAEIPSAAPPRITSLADLRAQRAALGLRGMPEDPTLGLTNIKQRSFSDADEFFANRDAQRAKLGLRQFPIDREAIRRMEEFGEATEKARARQEDLADAITASFESRGMEALLEGDFGDAIKGFTKDIIELIFRLAVLKPLAETIGKSLAGIGAAGGGGIGGWIAGLFGFAEGGRPPVGVPSIVGEFGRELFVPDVPGTILTGAQALAAMGGGGGGISIVNNIDARGANSDMVPRLESMLERRDQRLIARIVHARRRQRL